MEGSQHERSAPEWIMNVSDLVSDGDGLGWNSDIENVHVDACGRKKHESSVAKCALCPAA